MSLADLDPVLVQPKRLAALGLLVNTKEAEFAFLRDHLGLKDSDLSKHMSLLVDAGYVAVRKAGKGRNRSTWFSATAQGNAAATRHVAALRALIEDSSAEL